MSYAELRAICRDVVEGRHGEGAGSDSHLAGVAVALAAAVPVLLDEVERLRALPFGSAITVGEIPAVEEGKKYTIRHAILVEFDTQAEVTEAIERRALAFGLFGETKEEVEAR